VRREVQGCQESGSTCSLRCPASEILVYDLLQGLQEALVPMLQIKWRDFTNMTLPKFAE
jgi:hypothetical protein